VLPLIDLAKALGFGPSQNPAQDKYIVAQFNQQKVVFHVHNVTQIHRISYHGSKSKNRRKCIKDWKAKLSAL